MKTPKKPQHPQRRILLVEDHPLIRAGLRVVIDSEKDLHICAEAATSGSALDAAIKWKPELVISDIGLPGRSGLELVQDLAALCPGVPVLILSMFQERTYAKRALELGARGYLMKTAQSDSLLGAIRCVLAGGIYVSPSMSNRLLEYVSIRSQKRRTGVDALSPREFEVFRLIGEGVSTVTIANRLHMSPKTVDSHREHMKQKLQIQTMSELIAFASQWETTQGSPS